MKENINSELGSALNPREGHMMVKLGIHDEQIRLKGESYQKQKGKEKHEHEPG